MFSLEVKTMKTMNLQKHLTDADINRLADAGERNLEQPSQFLCVQKIVA
jgi:hypothetical protein